MEINKLIENKLERYGNEAPELFILENKKKLELFVENSNEVSLDYLPTEYVARFYLMKHYQSFWHNPNEDNFRLLLDNLFYYYSSYIVYISDLKRKDEIVNQVGLSSLFLGVLTFFSKTESDIMLSILIERIEYKLETDENSMIYYQDTILYESLLMYDKFYDKDNSIFWKKYINRQFNSIYLELIENICTDDKVLFNKLIDNICMYHLRKSKYTSFYKNEFYYTEWQVFPTEIIVLLRYRYLQGKNIDFVANDLVKKIIPFLTVERFALSEQTNRFKDVLYKKYLPIVMTYLKSTSYFYLD